MKYVSQEIIGRTKIVTGKTNSIHSTDGTNDRLVNPFMPDVPFQPDQLLRPPKQQPIKQNIPQIYKKLTLTLKSIWILKKTHHFKKVTCRRHFKDQTSHFFSKPKRISRPYK